jgi:hypothetical protein
MNNLTERKSVYIFKRKLYVAYHYSLFVGSTQLGKVLKPDKINPFRQQWNDGDDEACLPLSRPVVAYIVPASLPSGCRLHCACLSPFRLLLTLCLPLSRPVVAYIVPASLPSGCCLHCACLSPVRLLLTLCLPLSRPVVAYIFHARVNVFSVSSLPIEH